MSAEVSDSRLQPLFHRIRSKSVQALGALVNVDNAIFYTASDVAVSMMKNAGIDEFSIPQKDLKTLVSAVSLALSNSYRNNMDNVKRTRARIAPKLSNGNASFGYRIGMALGSQLVNEDTIRQSKVNLEVFENLQKNKYATAERLVNVMSFRELSDLELAIQARKEQLYNDMERKLIESKARGSRHILLDEETSS